MRTHALKRHNNHATRFKTKNAANTALSKAPPTHIRFSYSQRVFDPLRLRNRTCIRPFVRNPACSNKMAGLPAWLGACVCVECMAPARNESGARRLRAPAGKPSHLENERGAQTSVARANLECVQALWNDARKLVATEAAALYYASRTCRRQHAFSTQSAPLPESFERAIQTPPRRASQSGQKEVAERGKTAADGSGINRHTTKHSVPWTLDLSSVDTDPGESAADWQAEPPEHHSRVRSTVRKWIRRLFTASERTRIQRQAEPLQDSAVFV